MKVNRNKINFKKCFRKRQTKTITYFGEKLCVINKIFRDTWYLKRCEFVRQKHF